MRRIDITIERLVVDGLAARDRDAFVRALAERLRGMADNPGLKSLPRARRIHDVDAGVLRPGAGAQAAAGQVAQAVESVLRDGMAQMRQAAGTPAGSSSGPAEPAGSAQTGPTQTGPAQSTVAEGNNHG